MNKKILSIIVLVLVIIFAIWSVMNQGDSGVTPEEIETAQGEELENIEVDLEAEVTELETEEAEFDAEIEALADTEL
jgi:peptidoglycan hydrolase CwlO-like protein